MKTIPVAEGKAFTQVDDDVYKWASQHTWSLVHGYAQTAVRTYDEEGNFIKNRFFKLHREILLRDGEAPPGMVPDHKDGNRLNNQRSNLRWATPSENGHNQKIPTNNTSGYKGVHYNTRLWEARINIHGKRTILGCFEDIKEAAFEYDKAAREHYGEFARPNFTDEEFAELQQHFANHSTKVARGETRMKERKEKLLELLASKNWQLLSEYEGCYAEVKILCQHGKEFSRVPLYMNGRTRCDCPTIVICTSCGQEKPLAAKGMCKPCYQHHQYVTKRQLA